MIIGIITLAGLALALYGLAIAARPKPEPRRIPVRDERLPRR